MILPLQVVDGKFIARCTLFGNPDQVLLGVVDSGSSATCVDVRTRKGASLKFAGDSGKVRCVHRNHREIVGSYFAHIDICGRTEYTTVYELDMEPDLERVGVNAILGWDVLEDLRITMDMPGRTGSLERPATP